MIATFILVLLIYSLIVIFPLVVFTRRLNKIINNQEKRIASLKNDLKCTNKNVHKLSRFNELLLEEIKEQEKYNSHNDK